MRLFPKILTVTLSLIACAVLAGSMTARSESAAHHTAKSSARITTRGVTSSRSAPNGMHRPAIDPSAWLTDVQSLMVANYEAGVARQERADAEALATERAGAGVVQEPARAPAYGAGDPVPNPAPAPAAPYVGGIHAQPFLICVRRHESDRSDVNGNGLYDGGYAAKNPGSSAAGAYQYLASTWLSVVNAMGHPEWGGDPRDFSDDIQDQVAWWTYQNQGAGPWSGSGCG